MRRVVKPQLAPPTGLSLSLSGWGWQDFFDFFFQKLRGPEKGQNFEESCGGSSSESVFRPKFRFCQEVGDTKKSKNRVYEGKFCKTGLY